MTFFNLQIWKRESSRIGSWLLSRSDVSLIQLGNILLSELLGLCFVTQLNYLLGSRRMNISVSFPLSLFQRCLRTVRSILL